MSRSLVLGVLIGLAVFPGAANAQRLELRTGARSLGVELARELSMDIDSLRPIGRGVWYHDVQVGSGEAAVDGATVSVHYVGMFVDGARFAATDRVPFAFVIGEGRVIPGWEDGISGMRVGGRRQLLIPAFLAYGREGSGKIPPDTPLVFDITLVGVR